MTRVAAVFATDVHSPGAGWIDEPPRERHSWLTGLLLDLKLCGVDTVVVDCTGTRVLRWYQAALDTGMRLIPRINVADGEIWALKTDAERARFQQDYCRLWLDLPCDGDVIVALWWSDDLRRLPKGWLVLYNALMEHGAPPLLVTPPVRFLDRFDEWPGLCAPQVYPWLRDERVASGAGLLEIAKHVLSRPGGGITIQTFGSSTQFPFAPLPGDTRRTLEMCKAGGMDTAYLFTPIAHNVWTGPLPSGMERPALDVTALYDSRLLKGGFEAARTGRWREVEQFCRSQTEQEGAAA